MNETPPTKSRPPRPTSSGTGTEASASGGWYSGSGGWTGSGGASSAASGTLPLQSPVVSIDPSLVAKTNQRSAIPKLIPQPAESPPAATVASGPTAPAATPSTSKV
jgi:hypothetical protein